MNNDDYYIKLLLKGNDYLGKFITSIFKSSLKYRVCNGGITRFSLDSKGDVYACQSAIGEESLCIGNIMYGIYNHKIEAIKDINILTIDECKDCWARFVCGGECFVNSLLHEDKLGVPIKESCYFKKELIKVAIKFCNNLHKTNRKKYLELIRLSAKMSYYRIMDPGVYCVKYICEQKGISYTIDHLRELCNVNEDGTDFNSMINCLNSLGLHSSIKKSSYILEKNQKQKYIIVKYEGSHGYFLNYYTVINKIDNDILYINDPICNKIILKRFDDIKKQINENVIVI